MSITSGLDWLGVAVVVFFLINTGFVISDLITGENVNQLTMAAAVLCGLCTIGFIFRYLS